MRMRISQALFVVALAVICSARGASPDVKAGGTAAPASTVGKATILPTPPAACDVDAYVVDPDPKGLNVRDAPGVGGKVVAVIPADADGTVVHLVASGPDGWVQIDRAEMVMGTVVFEKKKGWVSGKMLGISTRGYGTKGVRVRGEGKAGKVVGTIPPEAEVTVAGCSGRRMRVRYQKLTGWLDPDAQCPNPVTLCN